MCPLPIIVISTNVVRRNLLLLGKLRGRLVNLFNINRGDISLRSI
jgi:hypothetical protein